MFWVDEIIEDILKKSDRDSYLICDWTTPSGHAHIGSLRGVIIHDLICQGLKEKNKKAEFQFGFDDFDPLDGLPPYIDQKWQKYMGMPLSEIPAPDGQSGNFAEQYLQEFLEIFNHLGIEPKIVKTSELYKNGKFDEAIKIVLDSALEIRKIYLKISGSKKGDNWFPLQVVCPKCHKIGTTKVTGWDGKEVEFSCEENLVDWASGCGFKGKISPFGGKAKLPWKVEWPAKWFLFGTDIEGEGKDHAVAGGSRDIANAIFREIFSPKGVPSGKEPPYDIPYEHLLSGGAKMSASKGVGVTAKDSADFLPPSLLRFLFVRTRAKRALEFNPEGETIPKLFDEYDRTAKIFQEDPKNPLARVFYYSEIDLNKELPKYFLRFSKIAFLLQMPGVEIFDYAVKEKGAKLTEPEKEEIQKRIKTAEFWLVKFAPENYKFEVQEKLPETAANLNQNQKEFLAEILKLMEKQSWEGDKLHAEIHEIKNQMKLDPREAFSAVYLIFIGKDSGPKAGWFLASLDRDFVIKRLKEAI